MTEYKLYDKTGTTLHLLLFSDVTNSKELLNYMQAGTLDPELAFLNALLLEATRRLIHGTEISLSELPIRADKAQIQKHYKVSSLELGISSLADAIVCRIAVRDAL